MLAEGRRAAFKQTLATTVYVKNALTVIGTHTPYQAVFGTQSHLLPPFEGSRVVDNGRLPEEAQEH
eukprot:61557-Amphidinium_carterae.1